MPDLASLFRDGAGLAVDRASAELRAGRPIVIDCAADAAGADWNKRPVIVAALDTVAPGAFAIFARAADGVIALSASRARALGLPVDGAAAIPFRALGPDADRDLAFRLAMAADLPRPTEWAEAAPEAAAGIALCKRALLLPTVLACRANPEEIPGETLRLSVAEIESGLAATNRDLEIVSQADVPLAGGVSSRFFVFRGGPAHRDQVAVVIGAPRADEPALVRMHSACLTGDLFGSLRCDCGDQLRKAVAGLAAEGGGVLLYLDQEGRGIGISNKMRAYALQDEGFDTIDADAVLGFGADERRYELAGAMLNALGHRRIRLMTNNPAKIDALGRAGIDVVVRWPLLGGVTDENRGYLSTKARRGGHLLEQLLVLADPSGATRE